MARVWAESKQSGSLLMMLLAIADFADDDGYAWPSVRTLATKCRMQLRNAQALLATLRRSGELEVQENAGRRGTNLYRVVCAPGVKAAAGVQELAGVQPDARRGAAQCMPPLQPTASEPSGNRQQPPIEARKHAPRFDANAIELPSWLPSDLWADWVADRQERRRPLSSRAAQQQLKQLAQLREDGHEPGVVIANSIANGYQGLFPPRPALRSGSGGAPPRKPVLHCDDVLTGSLL